MQDDRTDKTTENVKLRYQRQMRGLSQKRLADLLDTSKELIGRWERGVQQPSPYYQEKLCVLFSQTAEELGFFQPHLISTSIALITERDQTTNEKLDQAESIINLSWEAWFASRPKPAIKETIKVLPGLEKMLATSANKVQMLRIKELIIRCHGLLGVIYIDGLQNDSALYHYMQAHRLAEEIQDINLTVIYIALIGDVLRRQHDKAAAIRSLENARDQATRASQASRGHVLQLLAYAYADIGNETAFEHSISEATDLLAFAGEGRDITKKEFTPFEVFEIRGKAYRDLGKPVKAIPYLQLAAKSLDNIEPVMPRWHALLEISQGQTICDIGDITTAVDMVCKGFIMAHQCHSLHQMNRVRKLLRKLENSSDNPIRNHPRVQDLKHILYETYMHLDTSLG